MDKKINGLLFALISLSLISLISTYRIVELYSLHYADAERIANIERQLNEK